MEHTHFACVSSLYDDFPAPSLHQLLVYHVSGDTGVVENSVLFRHFAGGDSRQKLCEDRLDCRDPTTMYHIH